MAFSARSPLACGDAAALSTVQARLARESPDEEREVGGAVVIPFREQLFGAARPQLTLPLAVAGLLGCVAWVHAAHLFLIRRTHELAVRQALGASRRSFWLLFLREAALVAGAAALIAVALGAWAAPLLARPAPRPRGFPCVGATPRALVQMVTGETVAVVGAGCAVGLAAGARVATGPHRGRRRRGVDPGPAYLVRRPGGRASPRVARRGRDDRP